MEILVVAFVLEDIAVTFELSSVGKGLIGSASFFGERRGQGWGGKARLKLKSLLPAPRGERRFTMTRSCSQNETPLLLSEQRSIINISACIFFHRK